MNALRVISPYKHLGMWVFDDERAGLVQEPFVAGADTLIDHALAAKGIHGDRGFRLMFSASEFPGFDYRLTWAREGEGGNWYYSDDFKMEAWLCPALFKYFDEAPEALYAEFKPRATEQAD
ncbi:MAG: hypothetical protein E2O39_13485 [Planctomycetota bacterium]|nr:MAG: hypothetical protein E2O39_13485 [Planctomycetota bacterium]